MRCARLPSQFDDNRVTWLTRHECLADNAAQNRYELSARPLAPPSRWSAMHVGPIGYAAAVLAFCCNAL